MPGPRRSISGESSSSTFACLDHFLVAISRRCVRFKGLNEPFGGVRYFIDSKIERRFVGARWTRGAAQFSYELERDALISSSLAGGSKFASVLIFRHMLAPDSSVDSRDQLDLDSFCTLTGAMTSLL